MGTVKEGARQAVEVCMKIKSSDKVIIVGDHKSKKVMNALEIASKKVTKNVKAFCLEDYGKRPIKKLPKEIAECAAWSTAAFFTAQSAPGEKNSIRKPLITIATRKTGSRQAHMPGVTELMMKTGMCANYDLVQKLSKKILNLAKKAKEIRVTTKKGTDFTASFSPKIKWVLADGDIPAKPSRWSNLPDGEVFTCPKNSEGALIVDGSLGDWFGPKYGLMEKQRLEITVKNSRVIDVKCKNKKLLRDFKKYIKQDKNANRIGEFAIGTNIGLKKLIGILLQDEKFPGIHIAVGDSYPSHTDSGWGSKAHCDMVIKKVNIFIDGKQIMKEGKFLIKLKR
ncbi:aminopeptidase [Nanoarchaeota archaeon]